MVYPSAMHTRFAHSLGVMQVASRFFDAICRRSMQVLTSEFGMSREHLPRYRQIVRIAALTHDLGHGPFSHAAEEVLPLREGTTERFTHEDYTAAIIEQELAPVINEHPIARNAGITIADVIGIFRDTRSGPNLVLKGVVTGQMDADRIDYLLRDSYHAGVSYGRYDLDRVLATVLLCVDPDDGTVQIGISDDGVHAVEGLLIARYMMFTQLYFHKTRAIYDYHLVQCLRELLADHSGVFPPPTPDSIADFLAWHDWRLLGAISSGQGGKHGRILFERRHFRLVYETSEIPDQQDLERVAEIESRLSTLDCVRLPAEKSWYRAGPSEILVLPGESRHQKGPVPLSRFSEVVTRLPSVAQQRLYVPPERRGEAEQIIDKMGK